MRPYVAGVDTSTQSCKVIIWDPASGQIVREGKALHPDGTEVHPDHWWAAFEQALDAAGGLDDVHALSVGGQQHGMVCLDADGQVIRPALLWNDTRSAQAAVDLIEECGTAVQEGADVLPSDGESQHPEELVTAHDAGERWWVEATGSVPVASFTVTKLRWLANNEPENAARIAAICLPHDWLTWKISGSTDLTDLRTDRSDASGTGYVATDGRTYRYDILARALRIDEDAARRIILPRICEPWRLPGEGMPPQVGAKSFSGQVAETMPVRPWVLIYAPAKHSCPWERPASSRLSPHSPCAIPTGLSQAFPTPPATGSPWPALSMPRALSTPCVRSPDWTTTPSTMLRCPYLTRAD